MIYKFICFWKTEMIKNISRSLLKVLKRSVEAWSVLCLLVLLSQWRKRLGIIFNKIEIKYLYQELRKLLTHFLKLNSNLVSPGQKFLTGLQAKLHYLKIISELPSYGAKCFSTNMSVSQMIFIQLLTFPRLRIVVWSFQFYTFLIVPFPPDRIEMICFLIAVLKSSRRNILNGFRTPILYHYSYPTRFQNLSEHLDNVSESFKTFNEPVLDYSFGWNLSQMT